MDEGIILTGIYISCEQKIRRSNDGDKISFIYLVAVGADAFKVSSDTDYRNALSFGDRVSFKVHCRAYNNAVYYNGELMN